MKLGVPERGFDPRLARFRRTYWAWSVAMMSRYRLVLMMEGTKPEWVGGCWLLALWGPGGVASPASPVTTGRILHGGFPVPSIPSIWTAELEAVSGRLVVSGCQRLSAAPPPIIAQ